MPALTVGPASPKGDKGDKVDKGDQGSPGPQAPAAPPPPPPAYAGMFLLQIGGGLYPLTSFAGCFDRIIGVEYED